ncbi:MAG: MBL fold metallo-hydrolase [Planctomycetes bacterium]|nr:MBL fold metallo-hydrolase [Planctomycetota bacterium]
MIFEQLPAGGDRNFAYLLADASGREAALVDPAGNTEALLARVRDQRLDLLYVVNTHGHFDHSAGNAAVQAATGAKLVRFDPRARRTATEIGVRDGDELPLGRRTLRFLHTPGHSPDSLCILCGNKLLTGDTLFVGKVGGTGYGEDAREEYESLHRKLLVLPDEIEVYPGHDVGLTPSSTIGHERRTNPFLLRKTFAAFLELKRNWLEYKREHGIA